jgi:hypothetical protein
MLLLCYAAFNASIFPFGWYIDIALFLSPMHMMLIPFVFISLSTSSI